MPDSEAEAQSRHDDYLARVTASAGDPQVEQLAWALCPYLLDEFDYPRLPLPKCARCPWIADRRARGCRHHAQQVALAAMKERTDG